MPLYLRSSVEVIYKIELKKKTKYYSTLNNILKQFDEIVQSIQKGIGGVHG